MMETESNFSSSRRRLEV